LFFALTNCVQLNCASAAPAMAPSSPGAAFSIIPHLGYFCQELFCTKFNYKNPKSLCNIPILIFIKIFDIIYISNEREIKKSFEKNLKKLLTNNESYDILNT